MVYLLSFRNKYSKKSVYGVRNPHTFGMADLDDQYRFVLWMIRRLYMGSRYTRGDNEGLDCARLRPRDTE